MKSLIEQIVQKLDTLPEVKILEVLDFIDSLSENKPEKLEKKVIQTHQDFEVIANHLADEFQKYMGTKNIPLLSDYAVSRAGIYEDHP